MIENNQAAMLNFVICCFLFGAGVPLMFPMAFICLLILYYYEKKTICRQAPKPADYEATVNNYIVAILLDGPILYAVFGYWMYSNPALIHSKKPKPLKYFGDSYDTQHYISDAFAEITPATPFLILFVIAIFARLDHQFKFLSCLHKKSTLQIKNKALKKLNYKFEPDFYNATSQKDRDMLISREVELGGEFGIHRLTID